MTPETENKTMECGCPMHSGTSIIERATWVAEFGVAGLSMDLAKEVIKLTDTVKVLRGALLVYAASNFYDGHKDGAKEPSGVPVPMNSPVAVDRGAIARRALAKVGKGEG